MHEFLSNQYPVMHWVQFTDEDMHYLHGEVQIWHMSEEFVKYPLKQDE